MACHKKRKVISARLAINQMGTALLRLIFIKETNDLLANAQFIDADEALELRAEINEKVTALRANLEDLRDLIQGEWDKPNEKVKR